MLAFCHLLTLPQVEIPHEWRHACAHPPPAEVGDDHHADPKHEQFMHDIMEPTVFHAEGNAIPVSRFTPYVGGVMPMGTTKYEKRRISDQVRVRSCPQVAMPTADIGVSPHPEAFTSLKAQGAELAVKR